MSVLTDSVDDSINMEAKFLTETRLTKPMSPGERVFFLHIEKTGGTALTQQLALLYQEDRIQPWGAGLCDLAGSHVGVKPLLPCAKIWDKISIVDLDLLGRDHTTMATWDLLVKEYQDLNSFVKLTVLREPVSRTVSMLYHTRRILDANVFKAEADGAIDATKRDLMLRHNKMARELDFLELLKVQDEPLRRMTHNKFVNCMTRRLSTAPQNATTTQHLDSAKRNLERLTLVGIQEDLSGTMRRICKHLDWPMPPNVIDANVGNYASTLSEETLAHIAMLNEADLELYKIAKSIHEAEMQTMPCPDMFNEDWARRQTMQGTQDGIEITMHDPIPGWGWHCREGGRDGVPFLCWTTETPVVYLPIFSAVSYELAVHCSGSLAEENWHRSRVRINGKIFNLVETRCENGMRVLTAKIALSGADSWKKVEILPSIIRSHHDIDPDCNDRRKKGLCVEKIQLNRLRSPDDES
jgi:hypothetical protein